MGPVLSKSVDPYLFGYTGSTTLRGRDYLPVMPKVKAAPKPQPAPSPASSSRPPTATSTTDPNAPSVHGVFVTTNAVYCIEKTAEEIHDILTAASKSLQLGELWADSGCIRGCGGKAQHEAWKRHLAIYGLQPSYLEGTEMFKFGDGKIVKSQGKFLYPVFLNGRYR